MSPADIANTTNSTIGISLKLIVARYTTKPSGPRRVGNHSVAATKIAQMLADTSSPIRSPPDASTIVHSPCAHKGARAASTPGDTLPL
ncbi:MAG: hypothetical protein LBE44_06250 [Microbacterium hominis]|nr:hypothetical protein [Microbacterium hominis]